MPLFKVWSDDKLKKKFVVAENFAELVSKGKRFCLYSFFMSAWRDRMLHTTSDLAGGFGIDWRIMIASNIEEIMKLKRIKRQNHTLTQSDLL